MGRIPNFQKTSNCTTAIPPYTDNGLIQPRTARQIRFGAHHTLAEASALFFVPARRSKVRVAAMRAEIAQLREELQAAKAA